MSIESPHLGIDATIDTEFPQLVAIRRHLHRHPDPSGEEQETSRHLYRWFSNLGFKVRLGPHGCGLLVDLGDFKTQNAIAIRADIDALRIHDAKQCDYRSQRDGVMHACGHDAHAASACGALLALKQLHDARMLAPDWSFRGIFQPAEETSAGAQQMIEAGALEQVTAILALHMDPNRRVGRIGMRTGALTANCDEMRVVVHGRSGHAARPHEASDPIAAAAQLVNAFYLFIPRVTDSQDAVVVTIGQIQGGEHANVIPEQVQLSGTLRTLDRRIRTRTMEHICRLADGVARTTETRIDVKFGFSCGSVWNDERVSAALRFEAISVVGEDHIDDIPRPSMGSEDFANYLEHVPGAMIRVGCASDRAGGSGLHTPTFDIDEEALRVGAKILARTATRLAMSPDTVNR